MKLRVTRRKHFKIVIRNWLVAHSYMVLKGCWYFSYELFEQPREIWTIRRTKRDIRYYWLCSCYLFISDKNDRKLADNQNKKLCNLGLEVSHVSHDPYQRIFNHSSFNLSESEKSLLCKGLNFAIPLDKLEYSDHL